ncbi:MAG TPA: BatA domain-containing protein, partial [Salinimicrobium sp.]|nr:BatA domain-containing protein [Salinimicrobium sp.]
MLDNIVFEDPEFFWLMLLLPLAGVWYFYKRNRQTPALSISSTRAFSAKPGILSRFRPVLFFLRLAALAFLITAL